MGAQQHGHRFAEGDAFGDDELATAKKDPWRERFLTEMECVVPGRCSSISSSLTTPEPVPREDGLLTRWRPCCESISRSTATTRVIQRWRTH